MEIPQFRANQFEHSLSYERPEGRMEVAFIHLPGKEPKLRVNLVGDDGNEVISEGPPLSLQEIKYRWEFYKRLAAAGLLGEAS